MKLNLIQKKKKNVFRNETLPNDILSFLSHSNFIRPVFPYTSILPKTKDLSCSVLFVCGTTFNQINRGDFDMLATISIRHLISFLFAFQTENHVSFNCFKMTVQLMLSFCFQIRLAPLIFIKTLWILSKHVTFWNCWE